MTRRRLAGALIGGAALALLLGASAPSHAGTPPGHTELGGQRPGRQMPPGHFKFPKTLRNGKVVSPRGHVPELDPGLIGSAGVLLIGGTLVLRGRAKAVKS